jgi:hypothetical protein
VTPPTEKRAAGSAYKPYTNTRRPGGKPDYEPQYRVLVHRQHEARWDELTERVGIEQAQRLYDHLATTPGQPPGGPKVNILRGAAGRPQEPGFSRTVHWRVPGSAARIDYQYHDRYTGGSKGDPHPIVRIIAVSFSSH